MAGLKARLKERLKARLKAWGCGIGNTTQHNTTQRTDLESPARVKARSSECREGTGEVDGVVWENGGLGEVKRPLCNSELIFRVILCVTDGEGEAVDVRFHRCTRPVH